MFPQPEHYDISPRYGARDPYVFAAERLAEAIRRAKLAGPAPAVHSTHAWTEATLLAGMQADRVMRRKLGYSTAETPQAEALVDRRVRINRMHDAGLTDKQISEKTGVTLATVKLAVLRTRQAAAAIVRQEKLARARKVGAARQRRYRARIKASETPRQRKARVAFERDRQRRYRSR